MKPQEPQFLYLRRPMTFKVRTIISGQAQNFYLGLIDEGWDEGAGEGFC